jgi:hypothetical protein
VQQLAQLAVTETEQHGFYAYFQLAKGMAEYRAGHFKSAIDWLKKCDARFTETTPYARVLTRLLLAMAYARGGPAEKDKASSTLAQTIKGMEKHFPVLTRADLDGNWNDWIHCHVIRAEAEGLLKKIKEGPKK